MIPTYEEWTDALAARHGAALQKRLSEACIAVCGLGGLGSNIAILLARAGVGRLILIDFDRVDITNLHRQQYAADQIGMYKTEALSENLRRIAPYVQLQTATVCVTEDNSPELLSEADVICEAFDRAEAKAMLVNTVLEKMPDKYLVAASGMAGMETANAIRTRRVSGRFYICGDGVSDVESAGSLFASRVAVCAAHQAHAALRIIAEEFDV